MKHFPTFLKVLCTAIYVCTSFSASSQITLEGTVTDEYDNPISGAEIFIGELPSLHFSILTNESGDYNFPLDETMAGGHSMIVSAPGFTPRKVNLEENPDIILLKSSDPVEVAVRIRNPEYEVISNAQILGMPELMDIDGLYYLQTFVDTELEITAEGYQPYTVEYNGQPYLDIILYPENYDGPEVITLTGTVTLLGVDEFTSVFIYNEPFRETNTWAWPNTYSYKLMVREDEELVFYADDNAYKTIPVQGRTEINVNLTAEGYQEPTEDPESSLITITGSIYDWSGYNPIPGATVRIKGTTNGAVADINGRFSIKTQENSILIFSALGYQPEEFAAIQSTPMAIILSEKEPTEDPDFEDPTSQPALQEWDLHQYVGEYYIQQADETCYLPDDIQVFVELSPDDPDVFNIHFESEDFSSTIPYRMWEENMFALDTELCEQCEEIKGGGGDLIDETQIGLYFDTEGDDAPDCVIVLSR